MKKILVVLLGILMTFAFIACDTGNGAGGNGNNNSSSINGELSVDDLEFDGTVENLPESTGTDPFVGITKLYGPEYEFDPDYCMKYYEVDSEAKVLTYYSRDYDEETDEDLDTFSPIYEYSYSYNETENTFSIVVKNLINGDEKIAITDTDAIKKFFIETIDAQLENVLAPIKEYCEQLKEEAIAGLQDEESKEDVQQDISVIGAMVGLNYKPSDITADNVCTIIDEYYDKMSSSMCKEIIAQATESFPIMMENLCSLSTYKISSIGKPNADGISIIEATGLYNNSKKWYEQTTGYFFGYNDEITEGVFEISVSLLWSELDSKGEVGYLIVSISDDKIICVDAEGNLVELSYTKTGEGENTVITVDMGDGQTIDLAWEPGDFLD